MLEHLAAGIAGVFTLKALLLVFAGVTVGLVFGALPGLTATMAVAVLVPFTFTMDPTSGLILLGAVYMGAIYGGAFSAILVNAPGTPSSIGTTFDGYPMARQGRGEEAIIGATVASVLGGLAGVVALLFLSPPLADLSLRFGPPEYFWVGVFGLTIVASIASGSLLKGLIGALFGLLIGTIGLAPVGGEVRFTFGQPVLQGGVELIAALIGLFCIPEVLVLAAQGQQETHMLSYRHRPGVLWETTRKVLAMPANLIRSAVVGTVIGILPGAGGNVANLVAYNEAKRASKHPERFGTGVLEGVVATETANNAVVGGGLIPLLTLGVPGAPPDAIIYGALLMQGLHPGAELFSTSGDITYTFILSVGLAALAMMPVGLVLGRGLHRVVSRVPTSFLAPTILFLTIIGSYAIRNNVLDVAMMFVFGAIGYAFKRFGFHPAPIVLGLILGGIAEQGLVQALLMGVRYQPRWLILFDRPISWVLIGLSLLSLAWPLVSAWAARTRQAKEAAPHA
ncbi:tripartite tricarboxylate transporter permease [Limnochorda pilosa]|uniref:C4-dicarboxylate ABC transporter permease n=1 Tax=Limnochorda pilosa TaxID=1555112 RepID=A0A0K2SJ74_LIMPI|nr:tripartite tricarboxylate transporter permease [Limnochorda pilosa]BAS27161.1 C4-dicarboxylate ABC transporter permease [Limnochorda pilosa]